MKKVMIIAVMAAIGFSSCKKEQLGGPCPAFTPPQPFIMYPTGDTLVVEIYVTSPDEAQKGLRTTLTRFDPTNIGGAVSPKYNTFKKQGESVVTAKFPGFASQNVRVTAELFNGGTTSCASYWQDWTPVALLRPVAK